MAFRPETAKHLNELVEILLHGPNSLSPGERELIATYVSSENDCYYCQTIHGAIAAASLNDDEALVKKVKHDFQSADISPKLKALLVIAGQVQKGGKHVTADGGRYRPGDPRYGTDCGRILHVQPLCRWPGHNPAAR
jgi:uncharacterized peroxidase-related enzyme